MTRLIILALVTVGVGIFTSDALTVIGCWVLVGAYTTKALRRMDRSNA
ncbi:hypothetical protein [Cryobacterium sp. Sr8]|nr:hypothetical protein [Cryobacterium sp. Sr8]